MSGKLSPSRIAVLERAYRDGLPGYAAADRAGCSEATAYNHFRCFKAQGIPRGAGRRRRLRDRGQGWPAPYTGPAWIGKPA